MDNMGNKMSKSVGNVVDVNYILDEYNVEAIRYYLISNTSECNDINFSEEHMVAMYNNELMAGFGNLFQRLYRLLIPCQDDINNLLKEKTEDIKNNYNNLKSILEEVIQENINIKKYMKILNNMIMNLNKTIQDTAPWKKEGEMKYMLLTTLLLSLNSIMILMFPVIPDKINELRNYLGLENINNNSLQNAKLEIKITEGNIKAFKILI
jgi:methionyl-tRNA synthetase